jgi:hypothetical protein
VAKFFPSVDHEILSVFGATCAPLESAIPGRATKFFGSSRPRRIVGAGGPLSRHFRGTVDTRPLPLAGAVKRKSQVSFRRPRPSLAPRHTRIGARNVLRHSQNSATEALDPRIDMPSSPGLFAD